MNNIRGNGEIVVQELRRPPVISNDAANLSRRHKHGLRLRILHPCLNFRLAREVNVLVRHGQEGAVDFR